MEEKNLPEGMTEENEANAADWGPVTQEELSKAAETETLPANEAVGEEENAEAQTFPANEGEGAGADAEQSLEEDKKDKKLTPVQMVVEIVSVVATAIVTIMLLFTFVFRIVGVVGQSMEQTLQDGDWLLVTAHEYNPSRGDIIIITQPNGFDDEPIVKRIIAVGGDTVDIDFENAVVSVNGETLNETYLNTPTTDDEFAWNYPLTVPEGKVFVMGDNRQHSTDSRSAMVGLIDERYILGQVRVRFSPIQNLRFFSDYRYE